MPSMTAATVDRRCPSSSSTPPTRRPPTSRRRSTAIAEGLERGRGVRHPARRDRHRQDVHDGRGDRAGPAPGAGDRPQQDARGAALQRVPRVLPRQRGRVLRLLLRLLPARGLRPRSRTSTSRRTRRSTTRSTASATPRPPRCSPAATWSSSPRSPASSGSARRSSTGARCSCSRSASGSTATSSSASSSGCSTRATRPRSPAAPSAPRARCSRSSRPTPSPPTGSTCSATRSSRSTTSTRSPARSSTRSTTSPSGRRATTRPRRTTLERAVRRDQGASSTSGSPGFSERGKELEAHRLLQRTQYDIEMLKELGFTSGIENYSRILDGRPPGSPPHTLIDYFPDDFVIFVDESHQTVPQIGGMYEGDRSRKQTLVDFGFRLPSAIDNRPLKFDEFLPRVGQLVMVSATPGEFERGTSKRIVEQIVRPTGIVDPEIEVRETRNQIDDLMNEVRRRVERERAHPGHDADQEDGRGPDRLPARARLQGPLPALRGRHARADPDHPRPAPRRVRRARRRQPAARGARPARGVAGRDPRRRQGGLPARRDLADPDDRPRGAQRRRPGADVRRQGDRGDAQGDRRDRPPPRDPARLQPRARDHPGDGAEGDLRHRRVPRRWSRARRPTAAAGVARPTARR